MKAFSARRLVVAMALLGTPLACAGAVDPGQDQGSGGDGNSAGGGGGRSVGGGGNGGTAGAAGGNGSLGGQPGAAACSNLTPVPRRLWRLSPEQYGNAVRDLLTLPNAPVLNNLGGVGEYAFFSDDAAQIDKSLQFSIYEATNVFMPMVVSKIPALAACNTGEAPLACATRFASRFGERAFRRPFTAPEVTDLIATYNVGATNAATGQEFVTGVGLMIQALLQSPSFLYRTELGAGTVAVGATTSLTPHEVATQLSFLFLNSTPDTELLAAADNGSIGTAAGITTQVNRLLALTPVKQNIDRIVLDWFNIRQLKSKSKADLFFNVLPLADRAQPAIQADLVTSAQLFIDDVLWNGSGKMTDLLTSQKLFVNQKLATLYGLTFTGTNPTQFVAITDTRRAGILTHPGFLWAASDPDITSIVRRGRTVHDDVICQDPADSPPAGLLSDPTVMAKLAMLPTEIDKSEYRMMTNPCKACHELIDPFALVLEGFGPAGQYRMVADGKPVTGIGTFAVDPLPRGPIVGPVAFAKAVNDNKMLTNCGAQKLSSYVLGRMIRLSATCEVQAVSAAFDQSDGTIGSMLRQIATAQFIRTRTEVAH